MNRTMLVGVSVIMALALVACSGGSGSPASPSAFPLGGATTISGTTVVEGGTTVSGQRTGSSILSFGAFDSPNALQVCVVGAGICVQVGESGTFELNGDFTGDVELHFIGPGQDVRVTVNNVQLGQTIIVSVILNGDQGNLLVESRQEGASEPLVEVCHVMGNGSYRLLAVDDDAMAAHIDHGDGVPGGPFPPTDAQSVLSFDDDCGFPGPAIDIEKSTNGEDADRRPGPSIPEGANIMWRYEVTNTGDLELTNIRVMDDDESLQLVCEPPIPSSLQPGNSFVCTAAGTAVPGRYSNLGTVTADSEGGSVTDADASHYVGEVEEPNEDEEPGEGAEKVELCHLTGNGSFREIEVSIDAMPAHLAHGDLVMEGSCPVSVPE